MDGSTLTLDSAVRIGMRSPTTGVLGPLMPLKIPQPEGSATAVTAAVKRIHLFTFIVPTSSLYTGIVITVSLPRRERNGVVLGKGGVVRGKYGGVRRIEK